MCIRGSNFGIFCMGGQITAIFCIGVKFWHFFANFWPFVTNFFVWGGQILVILYIEWSNFVHFCIGGGSSFGHFFIGGSKQKCCIGGPENAFSNRGSRKCNFFV